MDKRNARLTRLLKLAAAVKDETLIEVPFGFDTRIVARWREMKQNDNGELARFVRRIALAAIAISVLSGVAAYRLVDEDDESSELLTNDYALVDSAIQRQFLQ